MAENDADREEGVNFSDLGPVFEELSYPISKDEFVERYGDREIERTNAGPISVQELFEGTGNDEFHSEEEVRQSVLNMMPMSSEGRGRYSDRGGSIPDEAADAEEFENDQSF